METVIRVIIIYVFILVGLRIMGKREFGQLSPLELITLLLIPELVAQSLVREDFSITNAIIAVTTLFTLVFLTSTIVTYNKRAEQLVDGGLTVLVHHGQLVPENMRKERVTESEIFGEMRKSGVERLEQVRWAVLESDGKISIVQEDTGKQQGRKVEDEMVG